MRRVVSRYAVAASAACLVGGMLAVVAAQVPASAAKAMVNAVTFKVSNADIFDNGYNQSFTSVLTATETGGGTPNIPTISGAVPGSGFTCGAPTTSTATTASCTIEAAPGPSNGDDSGVIGANGTSNTVSFADTDSSNENGTGIPYTGTQTMIIYPAPICGASGVNPFTGVAGTAGALIAPADTTYGSPAVAESCYNGASGPPSALLTNVNSAGGTIFMGSNAIDAAGGTALTIMAGPGFNWTGGVGSGEADVDTGTAGLSKQAWSSATVTLVTVTGGSPNVSTTASSVPALFPNDVTDAGVTVSGTDIPAGTTVLSGQGTGTVMLSQNATATPAGPETLTFTWASTASSPPSAYMTSSSTVASEASFKSSGDPINTCPPQQALIDAGLPFCFEEFETTGSGPSAAQVAVEYAGQNVPSAQTPTVALSQASGGVGASIGITDQSGQCPASIGAGTPYSFSSTYSCWYGRAGDATPVTVTVGGVPATVTPTNALVGDVSEADYTVGTSSTVTYTSVLSGSNQISVTSSPSTPGSVPSAFPGSIVGDGVSGTGIPVGATVTSTNGTTATLSASATANGTSTVTKVVLVSGSPNVTTTASSVPVNFYPALVGSTVTGTDIPGGTTVLSETPTSLTLSASASGSVPAGETLTFNPGPETVTFYPVNLDPPQLNASFTVGAGTPTGNQTVEVCETTTPNNGNDWEFGVQWMATAGSLGYVSGSSGPTQVCSSTTLDVLVTAASSTTSTPTSSSIVLGNTNTDSAVVTGNATLGSPTGTVSFYECGPTATAQPCTSQTDQLGSAVGVTAGAGNTSSAGSATFTPTSAGYWCFGAYYSGDANYSSSSDTSTDECFDVTQADTVTTTTPSNSSVVLGNSVTDGAVVAGNAAGGSPTGAVNFYQCGPTATPQPCTSQANQVGSSVGVTAGAGNTSSAGSASFTPTSTGYWCFAGYYSGDSNYSSSSDTSTDECFDVTAASSSTTSTPGSSSIVLGNGNTDSAVVTGNAAGGSPTGSVSFYQCGPTATPQPCTSQANQVGSSVGVTAGAGNTSSATSTSEFFPGTTGY